MTPELDIKFGCSRDAQLARKNTTSPVADTGFSNGANVERHKREDVGTDGMGVWYPPQWGMYLGTAPPEKILQLLSGNSGTCFILRCYYSSFSYLCVSFFCARKGDLLWRGNDFRAQMKLMFVYGLDRMVKNTLGYSSHKWLISSVHKTKIITVKRAYLWL